MKHRQAVIDDGRESEIAGQLNGKPAAYLFCRTFGHSWKDPERTVLDTDTIHVSVECDTCGGETWKQFTLRGSIIRRGSRMPGDYRLRETGQLSTVDRDVIRAAYLVRLAEGE